jgi:dinuclear metal center YbgI/SA1388 family protein
VGLQLGKADATISKILVCLDISPRVVTEAGQWGAQLLVSHHPLFHTPLTCLDLCSPLGELIGSLISAGLNVYVAHTNLDVAPGGTNDILARKIGLQDIEILQPQPEELYKVVVFVPKEQAQAVYEAMAEAGAGRIGSYSHCSFWLEGSGTFQPTADAQPFVGKKGEVNRVSEIRIESLVTKDRLSRVMQAVYRTHPYEEAACDIYPVSNWGRERGLGRIGSLPRKLRLEELCAWLKQKLGLPGLRLVGEGKTKVNRVAVCSGSGGQLIPLARAAGAEVFISGDIKYHQAHQAHALGLAVVDIGHFHSEQPIVDEMATRLRQLFKQARRPVEVAASRVEEDIFCFV